MITKLKKRSFFQKFLVQFFTKNWSPKALSVKHKAKGEPKALSVKHKAKGEPKVLSVKKMIRLRQKIDIRRCNIYK